MLTNIIIIRGNLTKKLHIDDLLRDLDRGSNFIDLLYNSIDGTNRINSNDYSDSNRDIQ